ncbi:DUF2267 domain-containing protein [Pseudonocardia endophytica]|uniref:Uncharacterized protein DUF2267 n=1 Tax=Pseudonocardia endophytica TaxID=401976 RepID=A0A4R1HUL8_PSEEN|nr:DUF2267 domain-containing protein [Pseudonocardia endophytica]TCK24655.1 uncharacterized protein DUF2267 [Pseudonocardia endophytica]
MSHPTDEAFLTRVQRELRLPDTGRATEASVAVLRSMAENLSPDEARTFSDILPPSLRSQVTPQPPRGGGQHSVAPGD